MNFLAHVTYVGSIAPTVKHTITLRIVANNVAEAWLVAVSRATIHPSDWERLLTISVVSDE